MDEYELGIKQHFCLKQEQRDLRPSLLYVFASCLNRTQRQSAVI
jgi:hypothetical protein